MFDDLVHVKWAYLLRYFLAYFASQSFLSYKFGLVFQFTLFVELLQVIRDQLLIEPNKLFRLSHTGN